MNLSSWLLWGLVSTVLLTSVMIALQGIGFTRLNLPYLLGTMFTPDRDRAKLIGFLLHLVNGWAFSIVYVWIFIEVHRATWWIGAIVGLVHGAVALTSITYVLPGLHPRMASEEHGPTVTRQLEPPGFFGIHYGRRTPAVSILAHVGFGALLGALYQLR